MLNVNAIKESHVQRYGKVPIVFLAPGRVNLIGEHTDYSEGFVMPAAIDFATLAAINPTDDPHISIYSENFREQADFDLNALPERARHHWSDYPIGC
jgi:galactokinase